MVIVNFIVKVSNHVVITKKISTIKIKKNFLIIMDYIGSNTIGITKALILRHNRLVPAGAVQTFAGPVAPSGWVFCDGTEYNVSEYPLLAAVIGNIYGGTPGTTFKVPDMRSRFALGSGDGGADLTNRILGQTGGAETHTLTVNEIPSHNHGVTDPGHSHSYINNVNDQNTDNAFGTETAADQADLNQTTGNNTTGISINNTGGGQPHNNMPPYLVLNHIIKY